MYYNVNMKIKCEKCGKDISVYVDQRFEQFTIGRVVCPECKKKQARWLTHFDLMMYLGISCIFYIIVAYIMMNVFDWLGFKWYVIVSMLVLYVILYIILKAIDRRIYLKAPFKKEWMNKEIYEDANKVKKTMRVEFAAYVAIVIMMGTGTYSPMIFAAMSLIFGAVIFIKTYFLLKNEKTSTKL